MCVNVLRLSHTWKWLAFLEFITTLSQVFERLFCQHLGHGHLPRVAGRRDGMTHAAVSTLGETQYSHKPPGTILLMFSFFPQNLRKSTRKGVVKTSPIGASLMGLHWHVLLLHFALAARIGFIMSGAMSLKWGHSWLQGPHVWSRWRLNVQVCNIL